MRIISGIFKGRPLKPPKGLEVRPTTDRAKESLFNLLMTVDLEEASVLDLFAGTGSISLEFVSRGAGHVTAIENNHRCAAFIHDMQEKLEILNLNLLQTDVFRFLTKTRESFHIVFADPPFDMENLDTLVHMILEGDVLNENGMFILEHDKSHAFNNHPRIRDHRVYGKVHFSIFQ